MNKCLIPHLSPPIARRLHASSALPDVAGIAASATAAECKRHCRSDTNECFRQCWLFSDLGGPLFV